DVRPARLVAFERLRREEWPAMIARFNERIKRYQGRAAHDATGIGDVVASQIEGSADGVLMVGRDRANILTEYIAAIERAEVVAPLIKSMESEHRLASVDDVFGAGQGKHLPDTIAASALAWRGMFNMQPAAIEVSSPVEYVLGVY